MNISSDIINQYSYNDTTYYSSSTSSSDTIDYNLRSSTFSSINTIKNDSISFDIVENGSMDTIIDYDYNMTDALNTFYWDELAPPLFVYTITYILGVVGNCLLIFTIVSYRRLKSTTSVFLASLASADLLLILICIPVKVS